MAAVDNELNRLLFRAEYPRSSRYDARWILDHQMGPNALWLTEWLCAGMRLRPGMRQGALERVPREGI